MHRRSVLLLAMPALLLAPARALAFSRFYLCFFEPFSAELSWRSRSMVDEFVTNTVRSGSRIVVVAGHADRAEDPPSRSMAMSRKRALAVAMAVREGGLLVDTDLRVLAFGATKRLVPTDPGVAEPQNRRVELFNSPYDGA